MLHVLCSASNLRMREKRRKTSVQADSQGHISNRILFHNLCEIEYPASRTLEHKKRRCYADVPFLRATTEIGDVCTQAMETIVQWFTFVLWCGFYSVSFQSFVLCHLLFATNNLQHFPPSLLHCSWYGSDVAIKSKQQASV